MADVDSSAPELHTATILQFRPRPKPTKAERAKRRRNARRNLQIAIESHAEIAARAIFSAIMIAAKMDGDALAGVRIETVLKEAREAITRKLTINSVFERHTASAEE